jgi:hypothetical protein
MAIITATGVIIAITTTVFGSVHTRAYSSVYADLRYLILPLLTATT